MGSSLRLHRKSSELEGIAAIVTGGASGVGEATAHALAAAGAKVTIFDLNTEPGESVAAAIGGGFAKVDAAIAAADDSSFWQME